MRAMLKAPLASLKFHAGIELLHTCRDNEYLTRMVLSEYQTRQLGLYLVLIINK